MTTGARNAKQIAALIASAAPQGDVREAFERWAKSKGWDCQRVTGDLGERYALPRLQEIWLLWREWDAHQAAAQAPGLTEEERVSLRELQRICGLAVGSVSMSIMQSALRTSLAIISRLTGARL